MGHFPRLVGRCPCSISVVSWQVSWVEDKKAAKTLAEVKDLLRQVRPLLFQPPSPTPLGFASSQLHHRCAKTEPQQIRLNSCARTRPAG